MREGWGKDGGGGEKNLKIMMYTCRKKDKGLMGSGEYYYYNYD